MDRPNPAGHVESAIRTCVSEALLIEPDQFTLESSLIMDLGAESIDLLDIRFRMEHAFGIKIQQGELTASLGASSDAQAISRNLTVGSLVRYVEHRLALQSEG